MQDPKIQKALHGAAQALVALALALVLAVALNYHLQLCAFPHQLVPLEAGTMQSVRALAKGMDPWSPALAPEYINVYGIAVPALAAFLLRLSPGTDILLLIRLCSGAAIFGAFGFVYLGLRDRGVDRLTAAAALLPLYAALLWGDSLAGRSDGLAVGLFLAGVLWAGRPGWDNALVAGALGALGYLAKPYAILALPLGLVLAGAEGRRRDCLVILAAFAVTGCLELWLVLRSYPLYLLGTFFVHLNAPHYSLKWFFIQLGMMAGMHVVLLASWGLALLWAWIHREPGLPRGAALPWSLVAAFSLLVLLAGPGGHTGAFVTYFNQLFVPFLVLALVLWLPQLKVPSLALALILVLDAGVCLRRDISYFPPNTAAQDAVWDDAEALVAARPFGVYPPILTHDLVKHGAFITDTDHTHVLSLARSGSGPSVLSDAVMQRNQWIEGQLRAGKFQAVVCGGHWPCPPGWPYKNYRLVGEPLCLHSPEYLFQNCFSVYLPVKDAPAVKPQAR